MTAADGRAHTTDRAIVAQLDFVLSRFGGQPVNMTIADALVPVVQELLAAERRRAAEDGQRLRERVEALADKWLDHARRIEVEDSSAAKAWWDASWVLRAALRDDTGDGQPTHGGER